MDDVRLGRKTRVHSTSVSVTTSSAQFLARNLHRVALIISPPAAGTLTLSTENVAVANVGIVLVAGGPPLVLDIQRHGAIVSEGLAGIMSAGTVTVGIVEVELGEE